MKTLHSPAFDLRFLLFICLIALLAPGLGARPNILILHADQWRAQSFGYAGDKDVKTPNIDALATESANLVNAIAPLPVCTPSRAGLLTGQHPLTNGVFMNDIRLAPEAVTLADVLAGQGYQTGYIGKWHLDGNERQEFTPPGPRRQGFQYWKALNCTHSYNHSAYYDNDDPTKKYWKGYDVLAEGADAMDFLTSCSRGSQPFFLMVSWGPPHEPYGTAPEEYKKLFDPAKLSVRPNVPEDMQEKTRKAAAGYYAHMAAIDETLGKVIDRLKRDNLYDNTIIMFTSDHGDMLGSHGHFGKQAPYNESICIPMLIHYPGQNGVKPGRYDAMFSCEDIMPTLLGLCGVKIPESVEGKDFSGYLRGGEKPKEDAADILCVQPFSSRWGRKDGGREYRGVKTSRYTYARDLNGPWILFDNKTDPYQMKNMVNDASTSDVQARLDKMVVERMKKRKDEFLPGPETAKKYGYPALDDKGAVPYRN